MNSDRPSGIQGMTISGRPIFDEARLLGQEDHRLLDHLFDPGSIKERDLLDKESPGRRIKLGWSLEWTSWELGLGAEFYARKGRWKSGGDILDAWLKIGPLCVLLEVLEGKST